MAWSSASSPSAHSEVRDAGTTTGIQTTAQEPAPASRSGLQPREIGEKHVQPPVQVRFQVHVHAFRPKGVVLARMSPTNGTAIAIMK